jgi:dienelactone hydrolase
MGTLLRTWPAVMAAIGLAAAGLADLADPGPFPAGYRTVTVTRPGGSTFTARLHYPAAAPGGAGAAIAAAGNPFPAISFGHGFLQAVTQYQSTCQHLATHGYLVIASESEGGLAPSHSAFAADLSHCLSWLEIQNTTPGAELFGRVDVAAFGLSGHSMGAGASLLAAAADLRVRCIANLAAAETNPSAIAAMAGIRAPVYLITGSQDTIVSPATNGQRMYAAASAPRQLPLIAGGFHCGFTDASFLFCDSGGISRAQQLAITRRLLTACFNTHLKGDAAAWEQVWGDQAPASAGVTLTSDPGLTVAVAPVAVAAAPGGLTDPLLITLTSSRPGPIDVDVAINGDPGWGAATARVEQLAAASPASITLSVRAPGLAGSAASPLRVTARAVSDGAGAVATAQAQRRECHTDWNGAGGLTVQDVFDFLADYFRQSADFDGVGGTTVQDLFLYLAAYFDGCA